MPIWYESELSLESIVFVRSFVLISNAFAALLDPFLRNAWPQVGPLHPGLTSRMRSVPTRLSSTTPVIIFYITGDPDSRIESRRPDLRAA
jgi:hypothetical protein